MLAFTLATQLLQHRAGGLPKAVLLTDTRPVGAGLPDLAAQPVGAAKDDEAALAMVRLGMQESSIIPKNL